MKLPFLWDSENDCQDCIFLFLRGYVRGIDERRSITRERWKKRSQIYTLQDPLIQFPIVQSIYGHHHSPGFQSLITLLQRHELVKTLATIHPNEKPLRISHRSSNDVEIRRFLDKNHQVKPIVSYRFRHSRVSPGVTIDLNYKRNEATKFLLGDSRNYSKRGKR